MDININSMQLLPPKNIQIMYPKIQTKVNVTWDTVRKPDNPKIDKIYYNVYRGLSATGIFYRMNPKPLPDNHYEDTLTGKNPNTVYWYKVSTVCLDKSGKFVEGKPSTAVNYQVHNTNRWFSKINERNMWILKNTGQLFDLYTRKTEGVTCQCVDIARGRAATNDCPICFGTGLEGGYEPKYQLFVRQKAAQQSVDITTQGLVNKNEPGSWTISSVRIKNRDLLMNPEGKIFSILGANINHAAGVYFHQELTMREIDPTDFLYNLERANLRPEF